MHAKPSTIEELQAVVKRGGHLLPRGGGTKPALSTPPDGLQSLEVGGLSGVIGYDPDELTFTALAGTRLSEVDKLLTAHGQYLPFDPPLVECGATLGGTVAAGLSGPGRYHYGGVGDFLLGLSFVDSQGRVVRAGGKVVKNVAGFDLAKLMVGSRGSLGVIVELSFKVFPKPQVFASLRARFTSLSCALQAMQTASSARLDVDALDLESSQDGFALWVRLGGLADALPARIERLRAKVLDACPECVDCQALQGTDEEQYWCSVREFAWVPAEWVLVKVPITPGRISALEDALTGDRVLRRYMAGGQVAWLALEGSLEELASVLETQSLPALPLFGPPDMPRMGDFAGRAFYKRVKDALDPAGRFIEV